MKLPFGASRRSPLERATEMARQGQRAEAEELLLQTARDLETAHGAGSPEAASAWNDVAILLMQLGQEDRAVTAMRNACSGPQPDGGEALKDRLTYESNLAQALAAIGNFDEAEALLRENLTGRERFYTADHPGYAFGLESLASLLIVQERYSEALPVLEEAGQILWKAGHPHIAGTIALRAEALKALNDTTPPFGGLDRLPDNLARDIVATLCGRLDDAPALSFRAVLRDLLEWVVRRFGPDSPEALRVHQTIVESERRMGTGCDHAARIASIVSVLATLDKQKRYREAFDVTMALGLALDAAGRDDEADAAQRESIARAQKIGEAALISQAQRNYGLYLSEAGRDDEAEPMLRQALTTAERRRSAEMQGQAEVALGIFLQHRERFDEARPLLEAAVRRLDTAHPDTITARSHLDAILNGESCGCGNTAEAINDACREFILSRVPEGMIDDLHLGWDDDGGLKLDIHVARPLTEEEAQHLHRIVSHAIEEFKGTIGRRS